MRPPAAVVIPALLPAGCTEAPAAPANPPAEVVLRWDRPPPDPPPLVNDPPDAILIRWTPAASSAVHVKTMADEHCLAWNRFAKEVREQASGDTRLAEFVCTPPDR